MREAYGFTEHYIEKSHHGGSIKVDKRQEYQNRVS